MIGLNSNGQMFFRDSEGNTILINGNNGNVYKAFFLESNRIIIGSYTTRIDHFANFIWGTPNRSITYNVYSYNILHINEGTGISTKRIRGINQYWRLDQVFRKI